MIVHLLSVCAACSVCFGAIVAVKKYTKNSKIILTTNVIDAE